MKRILMHYRKDEHTGQITILIRSNVDNNTGAVLITKAFKDEGVEENFRVESALLSQETADIISGICEFESFNYSTIPDFLNYEEKLYIRDLARLIKGA